MIFVVMGSSIPINSYVKRVGEREIMWERRERDVNEHE